MTNMLQLMLSLFAGAGVGALFFEGLWRTVSQAAATTTSVRRFVLSFAVRAAILLTVLWLVSRGDPFRLAAYMLGFLVGRTVILRMHRGGKEVAD